MLRLLMGRARSGKSERVLDEIARMGREAPERRQILMVPEHASHVAEMDVCRVCGDSASRHVEVLTFKLLASRVLSIVGGSADVTLDTGGKLLTLQRALHKLSGVLNVYRRPSHRSAFLKSLLDALEELTAYAVSPERLAETVADIPGESGRKLRDVALLYGVYLADLTADGHDARDRLQKLEEGLAASAYIDGKDVYLDAFSYFTGRELRILRIMLRRARNVTVVLLGDGNDRTLFRESLRVREQLLREAKDADVSCEIDNLPDQPVRTALDHVERYFFGSATQWEQSSDCVRVWEARDAYEEAERVAAEITRLARQEGFRWRDIAITARNLSAYEGVIETVFARYGVPLYRAQRSDILQQPLTALVLGALDAVAGGFEYEDVFRCLKTGLAGLTLEECDVLENYVITWDIRGAMWLRDIPWTAHPLGYGAKWDDAAAERLELVNALRVRVRASFATLAEGLRQDAASEKAAALYRYLEQIGLPEALEALTRRLFEGGEMQRAEETAQLWSILCGVLDQFVSILGDAALEDEEFAQLMRLVLTQYSVGTIPVALDRVSFTEMTRNDRHTVRALFLLGANDGVLPAAETDGGVLREEDRLVLEERGLSLSPHGMAAFHLELQNLYAALAQPTRRLYVSYPLLDRAGEALRPSFVVGRLRTLLPSLAVERDEGDKAYRLTALKPALEYAAEHIDGVLWHALEEWEALAPVLSAIRGAARYERGTLSADAVRALYGQSIALSASRMDRARSCHFAYFMEYGLRARRRAAAGFDAPQMGSFVHDVLENTLRAARERGGLKSLDKKDLHAMTRAAIAAYIERALPDLPEKTARFRYLFQRLCESVYRMINEVTDELRTGDFEPLAFELSFGKGGVLPAICFQAGRSEVHVSGQVDRVDGWLCDGKLYLRVVDYKTGKKTLDLSELRYGLGIQMLLYLFALQREGRGLFGGYEIVPAGVLYTPARDEILPLPRDADDEMIRRAAQKALRRSGMVLSDDEVLCAMEHSALTEPQRLPITVKTEKDGTRSLSGSLATAEQLGKLARYVDKLVRDIAREAECGNIDADPCVRSAKETACTYCPYAAACGFEDGNGHDRYEYIEKMDTEGFWNAIDTALERGERDG